MFNSLATQYLFQTPDCHLFTNKVGCISGCVSGISPVLELGRCVLLDSTIIQQLKALFCQDFGLLFIFFGGWISCFASSLSNHRVVNIIGGSAFPEWLSSGVAPDV